MALHLSHTSEEYTYIVECKHSLTCNTVAVIQERGLNILITG